MNHGPRDTEAFFRAVGEGAAKALDSSAMALLSGGSLSAQVIPPAVSLTRALELAGRAPFAISVGSQNTHWEKKGAFTGEVSGPMLAELGIKWSLTGHSERRQFFGETDETVRKRTESLLEQGIRVIACIGETRAEREAGRTLEILTRQMNGIFPEPGRGAAAALDGRLVIAYEPVWAIGTGLTATPEQAEDAQKAVRKLLWDRFGMDAAARTSILYGGSVTPENVDALLACPNVDGALVGGASLKPESFLALLAGGARALR